MSPIVSSASAICAAALFSLLPATSHADTFHLSARLLPLALQKPWAALPKLELGHTTHVSTIGMLPALSSTRLPLAIDPALATWGTQDNLSLSLKLELPSTTTPDDDRPNTDLLASLNLPQAVPPLIRYTDEATDVTLSISPGSPCTAACLKLAGSF